MKKVFKSREQRNAKLTSLADHRENILIRMYETRKENEFIGGMFIANLESSLEEIIYNN